jgi:60 kDa SS-A/Ro ribonucleoprotein
MKTNSKATEAASKLTTHGGAAAAKEGPEKELLRTVSCCLLWEDSFYESGDSLAERIKGLCEKVSMKFLADLAVRARMDLKLRHVPLFLVLQMLKKKASEAERNLISETIATVVNRADETAEILALYWKDGKKKLPRQLKGGIAKAFRKFDEYQLSKWDREKAVKLRDALFLSHAKPKDKEQAKLWKKLVDDKLAPPLTWEVLLSGGMSKKDAFTKLLNEKKLGYMATLQNLRNMEEGGVDRGLIEKRLVEGAEKSWALPFRFITAAKYVPKLEGILDKAMVAAAAGLPKLGGRTLLVIDVSGSMQGALSESPGKKKRKSAEEKAPMSRVDAACGLSILLREQAEDITVYATAGNDTSRVHATSLVPSRHGMALRDAIVEAMGRLGGGGIFLKQCMEYIKGEEKKPFDRVIVITDEQDCDAPHVKASSAPQLGEYNYIVNVGVYEPALPVTGAGWIRVSGFSERVVDWMMAEENPGVRANKQ